jgi:histidinol-phosphatase (PHP family)
MICSDFHTHTNFVDGKHTPEEVVCSAIEKGMKTLGISEHIYTPLDEKFSMTPQSAVAYRREMADLKEKYKDKITLLCGAEVDMTSRDCIEDYDYIIGSVHYLEIEGQTCMVDYSPEHVVSFVHQLFGGDFDAYAKAYFEQVGNVAEKLGANIIGHFDIINKFCEKGVGCNTASPAYQKYWQQALEKLAGKAALEINTGAISRGWRTTPYPGMDVLKYWKKLGGEVVITSDSHHKDTLLYAFDSALTLAKAAGFERFGFTDKKGVFHQQSGEKV